jgi:maltose O-acetyltransferase
LKIIWSIVDLPRRIHGHLKRAYLKSRFKKLGNNFIFDPEASQFSPETTIIGNDVFIGYGATVVGEVHLEDNIMFGPKATLVGGTHLFAKKGQWVRWLKPEGNETRQPVYIEKDVWCGANVTIVGKVRIGMGAVIGAGSVVVKDIPPFVLAAGNPCRPKRKIFSDEELLDHLRLLSLPDKEAEDILARRHRALFSAQATGIPTIGASDAHSLPNTGGLKKC